MFELTNQPTRPMSLAKAIKQGLHASREDTIFIAQDHGPHDMENKLLCVK